MKIQLVSDVFPTENLYYHYANFYNQKGISEVQGRQKLKSKPFTLSQVFFNSFIALYCSLGLLKEMNQERDYGSR